MKVIVYLKIGKSFTYSDARVTPASMGTPYYLVIAKDGLHYFDKDTIERITELKNVPED